MDDRLQETGTPTLVHRLRWRAEQQAQRTAFTFLPTGDLPGEGGRVEEMTYGELDRRAGAVAAALAARQAGAGERVLLLLPPGLEYVAVFLGCLRAGAVAVPAYPPRNLRRLDRLEAIVADARPRLAVTSAVILDRLEKAEEGRGILSRDPERDLRWVTAEELLAADAAEGLPPLPAADHLAFLQYTSGSTATPKGVMVRHGNLTANMQALFEVWGHDESDVLVSWLPPFHDMGLVYGLLTPLWGGFQAVVMPPVAFLQRPWRWLAAISAFRGTHSTAPNFAFELCAETISEEKREELDLRSWRVAGSGAEPVRPATLRRFAEAFAASGFDPQAFCPGYGLAEFTLMASATAMGQAPGFRRVDAEALQRHRVAAPAGQAEGLELTSCGAPGLDTEVRVVDPESRHLCAPDTVGEIWLAGRSVAAGYWRRPEATAETFEASLEGAAEDTPGPWLRTGDLGFVADGQLFITGRIKDLIIVRGRNHYPQDLEVTVQAAHPALAADGGAAFALEVPVAGGGLEEGAVVVQEMRRTSRREDPVPIFEAVRRAVAREHEIELHAICLVLPGGVLKTSSGKVRRRACRDAWLAGELPVVAEWRREAAPPQAAVARPAAEDAAEPLPAESATALADWLVRRLAEKAGVEPAAIDPRRSFDDHGLGSQDLVRLSGELEEHLGVALSPTLLYEYSTVEALSRHLATGSAEPSRPVTPVSLDRQRPEAVAVVGAACRLPGADSLEAFWQLLAAGRDAVTEVPAERWDAAAVAAEAEASPDWPAGHKVPRRGGFITGAERFDESFFGISPREAELMDPQQRLLLEVAWEALEDAGQPPERLRGSDTGVFVGISGSDHGHRTLGEGASDPYAGTGAALSIAANRLSYVLDLRGPSLAVDTACSSSLVALDLAAKALRSGRCRLALAGGSNLLLSSAVTVSFARAGFLAPDGRCKTFDAAADGYARGEGVVVLVLKPLAAAVTDGDRIYALVAGAAINQDGRSNGLTAPNPASQVAVVRAACQDAGVSPGRVSYVEAHGTGTRLGDPIEVLSLGQALAEDRPAGHLCALGSVKSNLGHLEAASGLAGVLKTLLALHHRQLPPSLHFRQANPEIPFERLPLRVQTELTPWPEPADGGPRWAGVSAFGFGGTNAHVILTEGPVSTAVADEAAATGPLALPLSARHPLSLAALAGRWRLLLEDPAAPPFVELVRGAALRRGHQDHRLVVVADSREAAAAALAVAEKGTEIDQAPGLHRGRAARKSRVAFVFPGQGGQWAGMGRGLYQREPAFREALDACSGAMEGHMSGSLLDDFFDQEAAWLGRVDRVQPMTFALQVALAALWRHRGIEPAAVVGQSMGEVAAACVAGLLSLGDAARVICRRSRLLLRVAGQGAMAVTELPLPEAERLLEGYTDRLSVAVAAGPASTVLSGDPEALEEVLAQLTARQVFCRRIRVDVASHSPAVDSLSEDLLAELAPLAPLEPTPERPAVAMVSTVTGGPVAARELKASYWQANLRRPVLFTAAVERLLADGCDVFLEISPHPLVSASVRQIARHQGREDGDFAVTASLRREQDEAFAFYQGLGDLYCAGVEVPWERIYPQGRFTPLPLTPFHHRSYSLTPSPSNRPAAVDHPRLGRRFRPAEPAGTWVWEGSVRHVAGAAATTQVLTLAGEAAREAFGMGRPVVRDLRLHGTPAAGEYGAAATELRFQLVLTPEPERASAARFRFFARPAESVPWSLRAAGRVAVETQAEASTSRSPVAG